METQELQTSGRLQTANQREGVQEAEQPQLLSQTAYMLLVKVFEEEETMSRLNSAVFKHTWLHHSNI